MKILIIYPNYGNPITGGQIYDHYFIERIISKGKHQIDFITDDMCLVTNKYFYNFAYLPKFFYVKQYDLILTNSRLYTHLLLLFILLRFFSKVKIISIHHHFNFLGEESIFSKTIHKMQELSFLKLSYATVIPSPYVKQLFHRLLPRKNVFYVELGIRNFITYDNKKIEKNTNFLYVGTVESRKGIIYLIRALNLLNNKGISFHCDIVGKITENNYFLQLKTEINRFGLQDKITFQGWLSDRELSEYYSYSTCFVFPSLLEGYGMVILEAMAYGLPVISFDNSAMPFTVKDGKNGILVKNKNIEELAESLYKIITDVPFREQLSQGALETYAHFRTFKDMDKDIDAIFQSNFEISKIKYEDISD